MTFSNQAQIFIVNVHWYGTSLVFPSIHQKCAELQPSFITVTSHRGNSEAMLHKLHLISQLCQKPRQKLRLRGCRDFGIPGYRTAGKRAKWRNTVQVPSVLVCVRTETIVWKSPEKDLLKTSSRNDFSKPGKRQCSMCQLLLWYFILVSEYPSEVGGTPTLQQSCDIFFCNSNQSIFISIKIFKNLTKMTFSNPANL